MSTGELISLLMPTLGLSLVVLVVSLCCCYHVHNSNRFCICFFRNTYSPILRDLHNELKRLEGKKNRYKVKKKDENIEKNDEAVSQEAPQSLQNGHVAKISQESKVNGHLNQFDSKYSENAFEDSADRIELAGFSESEKNTDFGKSTPEYNGSSNMLPLFPPSPQPSPQPSPGYKANMRLLFNQRPSSATLEREVGGEGKLMLKSRPASAVSTILPTYNRCFILTFSSSNLVQT